MKSKDKSFRSSQKECKVKKEKNDNEIYTSNEAKFYQNMSDNEEESNEETNSNKSKDSDESESLDEERLSLRQIEKIIERKKKKEAKKSLLRNKTLRDDICRITYDEKKGKILDVFYQSAEELNTFLVTCEIKKVNLEEITPSSIDKSVTFDPNEWMKSNKINERLLNFEDLSVYCKKNIKNKKKKKIEDNPKPSNNVKKEEKSKEEYIKKEKLNQYLFKDNCYIESYNELRQILSREMLTVDQKIWANIFIKELNEIDIDSVFPFLYILPCFFLLF